MDERSTVIETLMQRENSNSGMMMGGTIGTASTALLERANTETKAEQRSPVQQHNEDSQVVLSIVEPQPLVQAQSAGTGKGQKRSATDAFGPDDHLKQAPRMDVDATRSPLLSNHSNLDSSSGDEVDHVTEALRRKHQMMRLRAAHGVAEALPKVAMEKSVPAVISSAPAPHVNVSAGSLLPSVRPAPSFTRMASFLVSDSPEISQMRRTNSFDNSSQQPIVFEAGSTTKAAPAKAAITRGSANPKK